MLSSSMSMQYISAKQRAVAGTQNGQSDNMLVLRRLTAWNSADIVVWLLRLPGQLLRTRLSSSWFSAHVDDGNGRCKCSLGGHLLPHGTKEHNAPKVRHRFNPRKPDPHSSLIHNSQYHYRGFRTVIVGHKISFSVSCWSD